MKGLALIAAGAAVIGLTACSHNAGSDNASSHNATHRAATDSHATGTPIVPVSCRHQYRTWNHGEGRGVMDALDAVTSAATAQHPQVLTAALKHARPAVAKAAQHPIPACADPRGYWSVLLMHVSAAVSGQGPASSTHAAMQDVPKIHHQLLVEVKQLAH